MKAHSLEMEIEGKTYRSQEVYGFADLPRGTQYDLELQDDGIILMYGKPPEELPYELIVSPHAKVMAQLRKSWGTDLEKRMDEEDIVALAQDIQYAGLMYPPVVDEGWHRTLAIASLGWDLPYFRVYGRKPTRELPRILP